MTLTVGVVLLLGVAALLVGVAKTAIGGLGSIAVAIFASVMPTRESTAAILLLLITGDVVAVWRYHTGADWALLRRLIPAVLPGLALGALFLRVVDDDVLRRSIGALLLVLAVVQLGLRWRGPSLESVGSSRGAAVGTGLAAGFTTMTANAAGPVMTLYLVAQGVEKARFLGTSAIFFLGVNLCKLPFSAALGLFTAPTVLAALALVPLVLLGAWLGIHVARRLSQRRFDDAVLAATAVSAVALLVR
ncbi:MAG: sulfite exporter TauE/SafE family protein [Terracoccus sp.]